MIRLLIALSLITSTLSRDTILIGDRVKWSIPFQLKEGEELFIEKPGEPVAEGIETVEPWRIDTLKSRGGNLSLEGRMILTVFDSGSFFLPPLVATVSHTDGSVDTLYFEGPTIECSTVPVDTASFRLLDIKGQIKYPLTFEEVWPWALALLAFAAIVFATVRLIVMRRAGKDFLGHSKQIDPPHIVALRSLEKTRERKLCEAGRQKQFYSEVTDALRQYIDAQYGIPAMEQTTSEIFAAVKNKGIDIDESLAEQLQELFETADYVKFAKHNASKEETDGVIPLAVRFVNTSYENVLRISQPTVA